MLRKSLSRVAAIFSVEHLPEHVSMLYRLSGTNVPIIVVAAGITAFALWGYIGANLMRPERIIRDVIMPRLGGYAVLATMRAEPQLSSIPVPLFPAAMIDEARAIGLRSGGERE